jgi:hypothetical protein
MRIALDLLKSGGSGFVVGGISQHFLEQRKRIPDTLGIDADGSVLGLHGDRDLSSAPAGKP